MRKDLSWIAVIADRSGSMASIQADAIGGFNTFIKGQRELPGEALVTLVLFDDKYEVPYALKPLQDVPLLDYTTFVPRGSTALLDAIGRTVNDWGSQLAGMPESERPENVIVVIITDGAENASREFNSARIKELITRQTDVYNWQFIYLAANVDVKQTALNYGIPQNSSYSFVSDSIGTQEAYRTMNFAVAAARGGDDIDFTVQPTNTSDSIYAPVDTSGRVPRTKGTKVPLP